MLFITALEFSFNIKYCNELCYLNLNSDPIHILAVVKGMFFQSPHG